MQNMQYFLESVITFCRKLSSHEWTSMATCSGHAWQRSQSYWQSPVCFHQK